MHVLYLKYAPEKIEFIEKGNKNYFYSNSPVTALQTNHDTA